MLDIPMAVIDGCKRHQEDAFEALFEAIERPVINFLYRMVEDRNLAEDLFQETFVRILKALSSWEPRAKFSTWVFTIARNLVLDHFKHEQHRRTVSLHSPVAEERGKIIFLSEAMPEDAPSAEETVSRAEDLDRLRNAIDRLGTLKREALVLRVYQGLQYTEIAEVTGCPVGTAKYRVHEAVRELAGMLDADAECTEA